MNSYKVNKLVCTMYDMILAFFIVLFIFFALVSPTMGNSHFYKREINDSEITIYLQESIKEKTDEIARKTGIEPAAFDFAVGQKRISATQKEIVNAVFAGVNYDYSASASIESAYHDGIVEYYRYNGLELDAAALDRAVPMACAAFNKAFGVGNMGEMRRLVAYASRYSIAMAVAVLVLIVVLVLRIFTIHQGRTKVFSHYGSALISAGDAMILVAVLNFVVHFIDRLYLTDNKGLNLAIANASNLYFILFAVFGVVFVIAGFSMLRYVKRYYVRKTRSQKQELDINRSLYVKRADGEDKTIEQIVNERKDIE